MLTSASAHTCGQPIPLASISDARRQTLTAEPDLQAAATAAPVPPAFTPFGGGLAASDEPTARSTRQAPEADLVVGIMSAGATESGDFGKTDMKASSQWNAGGQSGDFTYSYPIAVPPVPGGHTPQIAMY